MLGVGVKCTARRALGGDSGVGSRLFSSKRRVRYGNAQQEAKEQKSLQFAMLQAKRQARKANHQHQPNLLQQREKSKQNQYKRELERLIAMKRRKAKKIDVLPLFKENSPLLAHFGQLTGTQNASLPAISFDHPVDLIHSPEEEALHQKFLENQTIVGIDTESRPSFHPANNPVCLIQIATFERAFLYRIGRNEPLPPVLTSMLMNPLIIKVGHGLGGDIRLLSAQSPLPAVNCTIDTLTIATQLGCLRPGLKTLSEVFLARTLNKQMQISDWESSTLSAEQIAYAATDAWAPLMVLLAMLRMNEAKALVRCMSYTNKSPKPAPALQQAQLLAWLEEFEQTNRHFGDQFVRPPRTTHCTKITSLLTGGNSF